MANVRAQEDLMDLAFGDFQVRSGFRVANASELAGGPIELEFSAEIIGQTSRYLLINSDWMRRRPGDYDFQATFAGVPLEDPGADIPDMGGLSTVTEIAPGSQWKERIFLNEFVRLEKIIDLLQPEESGELIVICRRSLPFAADEEGAFALHGDTPMVEVRLAFELRRDDAGLARLVEQLIADVRDAGVEQLERRLNLLLSLRAPAAIERWRTLVDHANPLIAERARERWNTERAK